MDNRQQILTRTQCSAMRGIAIIGIFLHNYCHWLGMAVKENEYTFTAGNCRRLLEVMTQPDWNLPVHLLSFFGHYGVPVFLFLSAYGLVMKYENGGNDTITPQTEASTHHSVTAVSSTTKITATAPPLKNSSSLITVKSTLSPSITMVSAATRSPSFK